MVVRPVEPTPLPSPVPDGERFILTVFGQDNPGIIHGIADCLAELGVNIVDLHAQSEGSRFSPVVEAFLPADLPTTTVHQELERFGRGLGWDGKRTSRTRTSSYRRTSAGRSGSWDELGVGQGEFDRLRRGVGLSAAHFRDLRTSRRNWRSGDQRGARQLHPVSAGGTDSWSMPWARNPAPAWASSCPKTRTSLRRAAEAWRVARAKLLIWVLVQGSLIAQSSG